MNRYPDDIVGNKIFGIDSGLFLYKISEIARRKIDLIGKIGDRRKPAFALLAVEITLLGFLLLPDDIGVYAMACYELAVIESIKIIKEQLNV